MDNAAISALNLRQAEAARYLDRIADLKSKIRKAAEIIDRNKYHQWEKIEDASAILREALQD